MNKQKCIFATALFFLLTPHLSAGGPNWFHHGWSSRNMITIHGSSISGTLTNYPALIHFRTNSELSNFARTNGTDILFTDSTGTNLLDFEIESYTNGTLFAWVRIPLLTAGVNTNIYIYYENWSNTVSYAVKTNVWDSNYQLILHCAEESGNLKDSTRNEYQSTAQGAGTPIYSNEKIIGSSIQKSLTTSHWWEFSSNVLASSNFSLEFWSVGSTPSNTYSANYEYLIHKGACTGAPFRGIYVRRYPAITSYTNTYYFLAKTTNYTSDLGSYIGFWRKWDRPDYAFFDTNKLFYYYSQNERLTTGPDTFWFTALLNNTAFNTPYDIGTYRPDGHSPFRLSYSDVPCGGFFDEVRVSDIPRGTNYAATVYTNLSDPLSFRTVSNHSAAYFGVIPDQIIHFQPQNTVVTQFIQGWYFLSTDIAKIYRPFPLDLLHVPVLSLTNSTTPTNYSTPFFSNGVALNPYSFVVSHGYGDFHLHYSFAGKYTNKGLPFEYTNTNAVTLRIYKYQANPVSGLSAVYGNGQVQVAFSLSAADRANIASFHVLRDNLRLYSTNTKDFASWEDPFLEYGKTYVYTISNVYNDGTISYWQTNHTLCTSVPAGVQTVTGTLGKGGGRIANIFASMIIPSGVFSADTVCTITPAASVKYSDTSPSRAFQIYDFSAAGVSTFSKPVTISYIFPIVGSEIVFDREPRINSVPYTGDRDVDVYYWDTARTRWTALGGSQELVTNQLGRYIRVNAETTHFSQFGVAEATVSLSSLTNAFFRVVNPFFVARPGSGGVTFLIDNTNNSVIALDIYSLQGQQVYRVRQEATTLIWDGTSVRNGRYVPNGLYVYYLYIEGDPEKGIKGIIGKREE